MWFDVKALTISPDRESLPGLRDSSWPAGQRRGDSSGTLPAALSVARLHRLR